MIFSGNTMALARFHEGQVLGDCCTRDGSRSKFKSVVHSDTVTSEP